MYLNGKLVFDFLKLGRLPLALVAILFCCFNNELRAQSIADTIKVSPGKNDSVKIIHSKELIDSFKNSGASVGDSSAKLKLERELGIKISKDELTSVVTAEARDSAVMIVDSNESYLYGKTQVNFDDMLVSAGQISFSQKSSIVYAAPPVNYSPGDTVNTYRGSFTQGKEKITYDSLKYNFKSKKALIRNAQAQYGEGFMHSEQIKRTPDQVIYGSKSVYTTCALDTPHFGITLSKAKIVPNKIVVSGPANLFIEGVPTPLVLPFALFPISDKQKSGFVIPTYTIEQARGLGLLNGGYYFYLNDNVDLLTQANIYTKGSYGISAISNYSNIYHYRGGLNLSYAFNKTGEDFEPGASIQKDFMINWRHSSDAKARPGETFNASVQVGSSSFYSNNSYDPNQILQNQYSSNISYAKTWQNLPLGFTVSALHSQNTQTKQINVTLPAINFHVTQFNPFASKKRVGTHWFDKITSSYTLDMLNKTTFYDSTLNLNTMSQKDFHSGIHHSIPVSASYTVLRYINMSFNVSYNEYWLTERMNRAYNDIDRKIDTIEQFGFYSARDFNTGVNLSTRIYGMKLFKTGKLRGIRHVITPNVGLSWHPDFGAAPFNFYYKTRLDSTANLSTLSPFANSIVGIPPSGRAGMINLGLGNNLQIKVKSGKDTSSTTKNVTLIDGLGVNTSYNLAADSFQWSNIGLSFRTNVLDKVSITSAATYDPYAFDYNTGRRLPITNYANGTGIARFANANLSMGANFHSKTNTGTNSPTNSEEYARIMRNAGYNDYVDFNVPWSFNVSYTFTANNNYSSFSKKDTVVMAHNATLQGEVKLTDRWKLSVNTGYNFSANTITLTSIDVFRDLHCWAMHFQAFPFGPRKSYNFTLNVKASVLQDLKIQRRRDYRDTPLN